MINGRLPAEFEETSRGNTKLDNGFIHCGLAFSILITEKELCCGRKHLKLKFLFVGRIKT